MATKRKAAKKTSNAGPQAQRLAEDGGSARGVGRDQRAVQREGADRSRGRSASGGVREREGHRRRC